MFAGRYAILAGSIFAALVTTGHAQEADHCRDALVVSTYSRQDSRFSDARLAQTVSRTAYDEITHSAKANATIYRVPMGGSYEDFQKNISLSSNTNTESITSSQSTNILWTGLDSNSVTAYSRCIETVADQQGLHLFVVWATDTDIQLHLRWTPSAGQPSYRDVTWQGAVNLSALPLRIDQGPGVSLVVPRPSQEVTLAANVPGNGVAVILTKLMPLPQEPNACSILPRVIAARGGVDQASAVPVVLNFSETTGHVDPKTDEWYKITAPCNGDIELKLTAMSADLILGIVQGGSYRMSTTRQGSSSQTYIHVSLHDNIEVRVQAGTGPSPFQLDASMLPQPR